MITPHPQHDQQHTRDSARNGERDSQLAESLSIARKYYFCLSASTKDQPHAQNSMGSYTERISQTGGRLLLLTRS